VQLPKVTTSRAVLSVTESIICKMLSVVCVLYISRDDSLMLCCMQNETAYHAVDGTDGHVDMDNSQAAGKRRARKEKKVDLDNLKREVEMVRACTLNYAVQFTYSFSYKHLRATLAITE